MSATTFNAITYANKLKEAGMATKVADVQAEEMSNIMESTLATKRDLSALELSVNSMIRELELRMIVKLGTMMVVQSGLILTVIGFLLKH